MHRFEKILVLLVLVAVVLSTPYLLARYKAFNYAYGQAPIAEPKASSPPSSDTKEDILAPNGKATLTLNKKVSGNQAVYTLTTDEGLYFNKTMTDGNNLTVPFNTWSPDNKYIFIKESKNGQSDYLVLSSQGKSMGGGQVISVSDYFKEKLSDYVLDEVTGWAADNLLVVNANNSDGTQGPSFWFDLSNNSFIRLSNRFN